MNSVKKRKRTLPVKFPQFSVSPWDSPNGHFLETTRILTLFTMNFQVNPKTTQKLSIAPMKNTVLDCPKRDYLESLTAGFQLQIEWELSRVSPGKSAESVMAVVFPRSEFHKSTLSTRNSAVIPWVELRCWAPL